MSDEEITQRHVHALAEHFDAVQILASRLDPDGNTTFLSFGSGNLFARLGLAEHWINSAQSELCPQDPDP